MASFLAVDYGLDRTGLAIGDDMDKLVFPFGVLRMCDFPCRSALLDELARRAQSRQIESVVLGYPLHEDGGESQMCAVARNAAVKIRRRLNLPMYFMPEILSSHEARLDLLAAGLRGKKLKAALDQQAACRILQSFFNLAPENRMLACPLS